VSLPLAMAMIIFLWLHVLLSLAIISFPKVWYWVFFYTFYISVLIFNFKGNFLDDHIIAKLVKGASTKIFNILFFLPKKVGTSLIIIISLDIVKTWCYFAICSLGQLWGIFLRGGGIKLVRSLFGGSRSTSSGIIQ